VTRSSPKSSRNSSTASYTKLEISLAPINSVSKKDPDDPEIFTAGGQGCGNLNHGQMQNCGRQFVWKNFREDLQPLINC